MSDKPNQASAAYSIIILITVSKAPQVGMFDLVADQLMLSITKGMWKAGNEGVSKLVDILLKLLY